MKRKNNKQPTVFKRVAPFFLLLLGLLSCQQTEIEPPSDGSEAPLQQEYIKCVMEWRDSGITDYQSSGNNSATTRAATTIAWQDGDRLYLEFSNKTTGYAVYLDFYKAWYVNFKEGLPSSGSCIVYHFKNTSNQDVKEVELTDSTIIYSCQTGSFSYDGTVVRLAAKLTPYASRLRFSAPKACHVKISVNQPKLDISDTAISLTYEPKELLISTFETVQEGKFYTPYIYPKLTDDSKIVVKPNYCKANYERVLTSTQLLAAATGVLSLPSDYYQIGWQQTAGNELNKNEADGYEYVDLGLPSGTLWATCNIGASAPEKYGDKFAWGETTKKNFYAWSNYKWSRGSEKTLTKYCSNSDYGYDGFIDNKTTLELSDDVARAKMGGRWRMPTKEELNELITECTWTWTTLNNQSGYKVVGPNGNQMFLPAAGYHGSSSSVYGADTDGVYWSSSLYTSGSSNARYLYFSSGSRSVSNSGRSNGRSVRAVFGYRAK